MTTALPRSIALLSLGLAGALSLAGCSGAASVQATGTHLATAGNPAAGPVLSARSVSDSDGASLADAASRCRGTKSPLVEVVGHGRPRHAVSTVLRVNGHIASTGRVVADRTGRYAVTGLLRNHASNAVELVADGHMLLRRTLSVACLPTHPAPSGGTAPVAPSVPTAPVTAPVTPPVTAPVAPAAAPVDQPVAAAPPAAAPAPAVPASHPAAPGSVPGAGQEIPAAATPPSSEIRGSSAAYSVAHNNNGSVTRWDPCDGPIHVMVNVDAAHGGALQDAIGALSRLSEASGLHFVYDGTTHYVPSSGGQQPAAVVIAWAPRGTGPGQSDLYSAGAVGQGGWRSTGSSQDAVHWLWKIVTGFVVLDPAQDGVVAPGFGPGQTRGSLLMHELGHVVGLDHSADHLQVMFPTLTSAATAVYGAGDRAALRAVGAGAGCVTAS